MTENNNVQDVINHAMAGNPKCNPDERRQYMGSLRERVFTSIYVKELQNNAAFQAFKQESSKYDPYRVLINGKVDGSLTASYLSFCAKHNLLFTLINDDTATDNPDAAGILVVADSAINITPIDILKKFPKVHNSSTLDCESNKKGFFLKLFDK